MDNFDNNYEEPELIALFAKLFPHGFAGADVLRDIAPEGWALSPLLALFHPSAEQRYQEALQMHRNLARLSQDAAPKTPEPKREEFTDEETNASIDPDEEVSRLVGLALWDIFSDGHDVRDADGREVHLGSFRASAGFLADRLNEQIAAGLVKGPAVSAAERSAAVHEQMRDLLPPGSSDLYFQFLQEQQTGPYDYMDFYMGTGSIAGRADLTPVYRMIFRRLQALALDWTYHFPRLQLVDFRPLSEAMKAKEAEEAGTPDWLDYSPELELAKEETNREKDREVAAMREKLDEDYRQAVEEALTLPAPLTVQVYRSVFGTWPNGWPPQVEE